MDLTKVVNYLMQKAAEMRQEADRYDAIASDLVTLTPGDLPTGVSVDVKKWKKGLENAPLPEVKKKRKISAAGRLAIKKGQEARWRRIRRENKVIQMKRAV